MWKRPIEDLSEIGAETKASAKIRKERGNLATEILESATDEVRSDVLGPPFSLFVVHRPLSSPLSRKKIDPDW